MSTINLQYVHAPHCVQCEMNGTTPTRIVAEAGQQTMIAIDHFWDEHGREHHHDPNLTSIVFACSHGHRWQDQRTNARCMACAEPQDTSASPLCVDRRFCVVDVETGNIVGMLVVITGEGRMMIPLSPVPAGTICLAVDP